MANEIEMKRVILGAAREGVYRGGDYWWNEIKRIAAELEAADKRADLASPFCPHISQRIDGSCPYCALPKPPSQ